MHALYRYFVGCPYVHHVHISAYRIRADINYSKEISTVSKKVKEKIAKYMKYIF